MRISTNNLTIPSHCAYDFCDGQLHSDPTALSNYLANQVRKTPRSRSDCYTRSYEKAQRLQRIAERARKSRSRNLED